MISCCKLWYDNSILRQRQTGWGGESIIVQEELSQTEKLPEFSNFLHEKLVLQQHWEGGAQAPWAHMPRF